MSNFIENSEKGGNKKGAPKGHAKMFPNYKTTIQIPLNSPSRS